MPLISTLGGGGACQLPPRPTVDGGKPTLDVTNHVRWQGRLPTPNINLLIDGLRTHVGNLGGADNLVWAYEIGSDSCDTTSITRCSWYSSRPSPGFSSASTISNRSGPSLIGHHLVDEVLDLCFDRTVHLVEPGIRIVERFPAGAARSHGRSVLLEASRIGLNSRRPPPLRGSHKICQT